MTELEKLQNEVAKLRGALHGAATAANVAGSELKKLRDERQKLIEGLRNTRNVILDGSIDDAINRLDVYIDNTLQEIGVTVDGES